MGRTRLGFHFPLSIHGFPDSIGCWFAAAGQVSLFFPFLVGLSSLSTLPGAFLFNSVRYFSSTQFWVCIFNLDLISFESFNI